MGISLKEFGGDNAELYADEREQEKKSYGRNSLYVRQRTLSPSHLPWNTMPWSTQTKKKLSKVAGCSTSASCGDRVGAGCWCMLFALAGPAAKHDPMPLRNV